MCQTPHQWWIFRKAILITDMVIAMGLGYTAFGFGCYYLASVPTQETYYLLASGIIQGIGASAVFTAWFVGAGFAICYKTLGSGTGDVWAMNTARGAVMLTCAILGMIIMWNPNAGTSSGYASTMAQHNFALFWVIWQICVESVRAILWVITAGMFLCTESSKRTGFCWENCILKPEGDRYFAVGVMGEAQPAVSTAGSSGNNDALF